MVVAFKIFHQHFPALYGKFYNTFRWRSNHRPVSIYLSPSLSVFFFFFGISSCSGGHNCVAKKFHRRRKAVAIVSMAAVWHQRAQDIHLPDETLLNTFHLMGDFHTPILRRTKSPGQRIPCSESHPLGTWH